MISGLKLFGPNGRVVREFEPAFTTGYEIAAPAAGTRVHRPSLRRPRAPQPHGAARRLGERDALPAARRRTLGRGGSRPAISTRRHAAHRAIRTASGVVQVDERLGADTVTTRFERDALGRIQRRDRRRGQHDQLRPRRPGPGAGSSCTPTRARARPCSTTPATRRRAPTRAARSVATTYDGANRPLTETLTDAAGRVEERVTLSLRRSVAEVPRGSRPRSAS